MALATKKRRYWTCKCGHRNEVRTSSRKCQGCGGLTKPKRRVPKHAETLRDDSYEVYEALNQAVHAAERDACGVCGRPPSDNRRHDRDHDHRTGKPRGLACFRCNRELLRNGTLAEARLVVAYLERAEAFNAE